MLAAHSVEGVEAAQGSLKLAHTLYSSGGEQAENGVGCPSGTSGLTLPPHCDQRVGTSGLKEVLPPFQESSAPKAHR